MAGIIDLKIIDGGGGEQNLKVYDTGNGYVPYHAVSGSVTVKQEQASTVAVTIKDAGSDLNTAVSIETDTNRKCLTIFNGSTKKIYMTLGNSTPSATNFSYILEAGSTYESTPANASVKHQIISEGSATGKVGITTTV